jgi:hypothetical protein
MRDLGSHPAIQYATREPRDAVTRLNAEVAAGERRLVSAAPGGYLRAVLEAFDIPLSSQTLVFSENSLQRSHISQSTPRAIYFNDTVSIGWANGAETIEAAVLDAAHGVNFYSMPQKVDERPQFVRRTDCLQCHVVAETGGVPGLATFSVLPLSDNPNEYVQGWVTDQRTPIADRWGGWYVTGAQVPARHLGNVAVLHVPQSYGRADVAPRLPTGAGAFNTDAYPTPHSDVVALLVLNHQTEMTNLLTRVAWEARIAEHERSRTPGSEAVPARLREEVGVLVDYMLFVDEAPLPSPVRGSSGFAEHFTARGPRDRRGRSLRELDLTRRLLRYPCSYMIYTEAFDALPALARTAVYERMWEVLSGRETGRDYARLSLDDRRAIVEILRETKTALPDYFRPVTR